MDKTIKNDSANSDFFANVTRLIRQSRQQVAATVNAELTLLYWNIGGLFNQEITERNMARGR